MVLNFSIKEIFSVTLVLFAVIDILGSIPIIIDLEDKIGKRVKAGTATFASGVLMVVFLFVGESILGLFGIDLRSFALAGAIIIFLLAFEMILGRDIFKQGSNDANASTIVPVAFPLIAGAGTLTTILSVRSQYTLENVIVGILLNLVFVYIVLRATPWIQKVLGKGGTSILRRIFGIVLLAIAVKLVQTSIAF